MNNNGVGFENTTRALVVALPLSHQPWSSQPAATAPLCDKSTDPAFANTRNQD